MKELHELIAYRLADWDTPLWINPNRAAHRYNRPEAGPTQYLSLHPLTPWAEYLRRQNRRTFDDLMELRLRVWALRVLIDDFFDLDYGSAPSLGLNPDDLVSDDYGPCQDLGDRCRRDPHMPKAIRVPSAALPGTRNFVIFGPRVAAAYHLDPLDEIDVPTAVLAEDARALHTLLPVVRYEGDPHREYDAWQRGVPIDFQQPASPLFV